MKLKHCHFIKKQAVFSLTLAYSPMVNHSCWRASGNMKEFFFKTYAPGGQIILAYKELFEPALHWQIVNYNYFRFL